jgi:hypothetical protein
MHLLRAVALGALALAGCDDEPGTDPCTHDLKRALLIGAGVGGAFVQFVDGQDVALRPAPQGGFGVDIVVTTVGLNAGLGKEAALLLETLIDGEEVGVFENGAQPLDCADEGGRINAIVVGFDPNRYSSNDDLLSLEGERVELRVTVTDDSGRTVTNSQFVTIRVGG